jgi:hypothetical protein
VRRDIQPLNHLTSEKDGGRKAKDANALGRPVMAHHLLLPGCIKEERMRDRLTTIGTAKRIRVRMPIVGSRSAWDCRPFGLGRIIAPVTDGVIEIAPDVHLDLASGTVFSRESGSERRSA